VVHELRDKRDGQDDGEKEGKNDASLSAIKGPKPAEELTPEEQERADELGPRYLSLCIRMLERVNGVSRSLPLGMTTQM